MSEAPLEVYSRISALEFVLEVMLANKLAGLSKQVSEKFKSDLVLRPGHLPPRSGPVDADVFQDLERRITADLENFARKVAAREDEIRATLVQRQ
jgi:hypothetical protein